jgi:hypothetical protein
MNKKDFEKLIEKPGYHFFIFSCPAKIPVNYFVHTRIVTKDHEGNIVRRELGHFKNKKHPSMGYIHQNFLDPWQGITKYLRTTKTHFKSRLIFHINGEKGSTTQKIVESINKKITYYPYKNNYRRIRRNSNTFTQRVINNFPQIDTKLPKRAIGK